jgi:pimeloyl-ACP methyl ester carboxylesterase
MTVLCVHGAGGNSADFTVLAQRLSRDDAPLPARVIAFDSPGNGDSPANSRVSSFTIQRIVIEQIIAKTQGRIALLASSGGAVATFTALYANRRKPGFDAIPVVFAEPGLGFAEQTREYIEKSRPFFTGKFLTLDDARRAWDRSSMVDVAFESAEAKAAFIRGRLRVQGTVLVPATRETNLGTMKPFNVLDGKEPLKNPTLVLWGEKGALQARYAEPLKRVIPGHTFLSFPDAGHPLSLTRARELDVVSQFLAQDFSA